MNVSNRFSNLRKKRKCPIYKLSILSRISVVRIKKIESGKIIPTVYELDILLRSMNYSLSDIIYKNQNNNDFDYKIIKAISQIDEKISNNH